MIIDMHTHIVPRDFPYAPDRASGDAFPQMAVKDDERSTIMIGGQEYRTVRDVCWDAPKRSAEMQGEGTDKQVLSPLPELLMYHLDPKDSVDLARHLNETIAAMVAAEPDHFYGLGSAPMQDTPSAVAELRVIKELGLHGVEIRSNIEGRSLARSSSGHSSGKLLRLACPFSRTRTGPRLLTVLRISRRWLPTRRSDFPSSPASRRVSHLERSAGRNYRNCACASATAAEC